MGCTSSATAVSSSRRNRSPRQATEQIRAHVVADRTEESASQRYELMTVGVEAVGAPANLLALVCLRKEAMPVVTSLIHFEDSTPSQVKLPVVAASVHKKGRILAYSQVSFLMPKIIHKADTAKLLLNTLSWVSGGFASMTRIGVLGFSNSVMSIIVKSLQGMGFFVEAVKSPQHLTSYKSIICPSTLEVTEELIDQVMEYVAGGGGLAVFYQHKEEERDENETYYAPANQLLMKFGLSYTICCLNEDMDECANIQLAKSYADIGDANFVSIVERFKELLSQSEVQTGSLDDVVVTLRYYLMVCDEAYLEQLKEIETCCWDFMKRTGYSSDKGLCPEPMHGIVCVLLHDLYVKLPIGLAAPVPDHVTFPGPTGKVDLGTFDMTLEMNGDDTWVSTGLWLPAGVVAHVACQGDTSNLIIRVGSQSESLMGVPGPWKRWPSVVSTFRMSPKEEEIGTPCGGIVYAGLNVVYGCEPRTVDFVFSNFCRCPEYKYDHPDLWNETKDLEVPWGEVEFENILFTMPTVEMRKIENFEKLGAFYNNLASQIADFMAFQITRPYRVVFDVEVPAPTEVSYPLFWELEILPQVIFDYEKPTSELFRAVTLISIQSIREDCFDEKTEMALGALATAVVFTKIYPDFNPLEMNMELPHLFKEFWGIHQHLPNVFTDTMRVFQSPDYHPYDVAEDMWIELVRELCRQGQADLTRLLGNARPLPMGMTQSYTGFVVFIPGENGPVVVPAEEFPAETSSCPCCQARNNQCLVCPVDAEPRAEGEHDSKGSVHEAN